MNTWGSKIHVFVGLSRGVACATKLRQRHMHRCPARQWHPPSRPPVSFKPCLHSRLPPPYDKRKTHPSIETESATPHAQIEPVPSIEHHNSPLAASAEPRPPTVTNACTSFESHEILPTTPPKTPTIRISPLSNNNSHPVDSLEPTSLPESPETPLITAPSKKTVCFADPLINDHSFRTLQPGNQPDYQPDDQPGYQPDPSNQLIQWAVVSDDKIDDTLTKDHDFRATNFTAWNLIKGQMILAEKCRGRTTLAPLQWHHNGHDSISNHQPHDCLLNHLFRRRSKKTSKLRVTGLCAGIHQEPVNSPHKWPVTRKMFPFEDVIMITLALSSDFWIGASD